MKRKNSKAKRIIRPISPMKSSQTDPMGMYTGVPINKNERPVQDADDL